MTPKKRGPDATAAYRERAEEIALRKGFRARGNPDRSTPEEAQRTLQELQVHQIELEMQNEELREAREELEKSRARYLSLYDLAPVGYCTVSKKGLILKANLTVAALLGVARGELVRKPLTRFVIDEDQNIYHDGMNRIHDAQPPQPFEVRMLRKGGTRFWARLQANLDEDAKDDSGYRVVLIDISDQKQAEEELKGVQNELEDRVEKRTLELRTALSEIKTMKDQLELENIYFRQENKMRHRFDDIIGQSEGLKYVLYRAEQVAPTNTTVLILDETGTGKELIAAAIHNMSPRREQPLITVNCAALPDNLIESELFGREKGAFTGADSRQIGRFEVAHGSTLCLDEVGELPLGLQAKLLRVLQHNEFERLGSSKTIKVDVRIVATTNRILEEEVRRGRFRQDLYYRLNVFPITVPPLRQRKEDIPLMVQSFAERYARKMGKQIRSIPKEMLKALQDYAWPGNVRELESIIERAVILSPGPVLQLAGNLERAPLLPVSDFRTLEESERNHILKILSETGGRIEGSKGAAAILGLHASTLRARMRKYGIVRPE